MIKLAKALQSQANALRARRRARDGLPAQSGADSHGPQRAKPTWSTDLVLVCDECEDSFKGGVDGKGMLMSQYLEQAMIREGLRSELRVVRCACIDLCPGRGIALMCASDADLERPIRVFRHGDDPETVVGWLRGHAERSRDH